MRHSDTRTYKVGSKKYTQTPVEIGQFEAVAGLFAEIPFEELVNAGLAIGGSIEKAKQLAETEGVASAVLEFDDLAKALLNMLPRIAEQKTLTRIMAALLKIEIGEAEALPLTIGVEVIRDFFILNVIWQKHFQTILKSVRSLPG